MSRNLMHFQRNRYRHKAMSRIYYTRGETMNLSKTLAEYISTTNYDDLPEDVVEFTKLCLLDYFGCAIAGAKAKPVQKIYELANEMGGNNQATLIPGGKSSALQAAL